MAPATATELSTEECVELLAAHDIARIALVSEGWPIILPVNYRLVDSGGQRWIAIRGRPEGAIDHPGASVALQLDGIDRDRHRAWSVLVRGTLQTVDPDAAGFRERFDPGPWLDERDAWLVLEPAVITGRRLEGEHRWAFHPRAYL